MNTFLRDYTNYIGSPIVYISTIPIFFITNLITTCVDVVPQLIMMYYSTIKTPPIYIKYNNYDNIPYELRADCQTFTSHNNKIMFLDKNVLFFAQKQTNKKTNEIIYVVDKNDGTQLIYTENIDNIDNYKLIEQVK